jgi:hypothetical protein
VTSDDLRSSILTELNKYDIHVGNLQLDEFTQRQFVTHRLSQGETWNADRARRHLTRLVEKGYLTRRIVVHNNARCYAYRKTQ